MSMDVQTLDTHKKVLGIIYVVTAAITLLFALALRAILALVFEFAFEDADPEALRVKDFVIAITSFVPAVIIIFSSIPTAIAGIGLLLKQAWASTFALIMGILKLISFPIGTAIGIYAIWLYAEEGRLKRAGQIQ
jgi:cytochrome bd-type quinol oxidase subunit 2